MISNFKNKYSYDDRVSEVVRVKEKYPDRIPIVVERLNNSKAPLIDKNKYLVPQDLTVGQFMFVIRKRMKLPAEFGLYLYISGTLPSSSTLLINLYDYYRDNDGFLYVYYSSENTFG